MAVTSYKFPGTVANDTSSGAGTAWTNPGNVSVDDTSEAAWSVPTVHTNPSQYLKCTNFGFTTADVPAGSTINGIEMQYRRRMGSSADGVTTANMREVKGGTIGGSNVSTMNVAAWAFSGTEAGSENIVEGGAANLWNNTWTAADVIASTFGCAIAATGSGSTPDAFIDYVEMRIYYTAPAALPAPSRIISQAVNRAGTY